MGKFVNLAVLPETRNRLKILKGKGKTIDRYLNELMDSDRGQISELIKKIPRSKMPDDPKEQVKLLFKMMEEGKL